jgi:hypothetical protein
MSNWLDCVLTCRLILNWTFTSYSHRRTGLLHLKDTTGPVPPKQILEKMCPNSHQSRFRIEEAPLLRASPNWRVLAKGNWQLAPELREAQGVQGFFFRSLKCERFFIWTDKVSCGKGDPGWGGGAKAKVARLWWTSNLQWMTPAKTKKKNCDKVSLFCAKKLRIFGTNVCLCSVKCVFSRPKFPTLPACSRRLKLRSYHRCSL